MDHIYPELNQLDLANEEAFYAHLQLTRKSPATPILPLTETTSPGNSEKKTQIRGLKTLQNSKNPQALKQTKEP